MDAIAHRQYETGEPDPTTELVERVRQYLNRIDARRLRLVTVHADGEAVILEGTVPSYHVRQLAISCARHTPGVRQVIDRMQTAALQPPRRDGH
jgi:osmotically-inducible protein OsmY